jgi:DNA polymerase sigma
VWTILYPFYLHLQRLAHEYYGSVEVIGSFASQLWIPSSDIDIMVFISDNGSPYLFEQITQSFYRKVQALGYYVSIRLLRTYKLPMIKLILNQQFQNL